MSDQPLDPGGDGDAGENGDGRQNGRDGRGRFKPGNKAGKGNPHAQRVQQIRAAVLDAVTPKAIKEAVLALLEQAKGGDRYALAELLDRTIGKPIQADVLERIERIEQLLNERQNA